MKKAVLNSLIWQSILLWNCATSLYRPVRDTSYYQGRYGSPAGRSASGTHEVKPAEHKDPCSRCDRLAGTDYRGVGGSDYRGNGYDNLSPGGGAAAWNSQRGSDDRGYRGRWDEKDWDRRGVAPGGVRGSDNRGSYDKRWEERGSDRRGAGFYGGSDPGRWDYRGAGSRWEERWDTYKDGAKGSWEMPKGWDNRYESGYRGNTRPSDRWSSGRPWESSSRENYGSWNRDPGYKTWEGSIKEIHGPWNREGASHGRPWEQDYYNKEGGYKGWDSKESTWNRERRPWDGGSGGSGGSRDRNWSDNRTPYRPYESGYRGKPWEESWDRNSGGYYAGGNRGSWGPGYDKGYASGWDYGSGNRGSYWNRDDSWSNKGPYYNYDSGDRPYYSGGDPYRPSYDNDRGDWGSGRPHIPRPYQPTNSGNTTDKSSSTSSYRGQSSYLYDRNSATTSGTNPTHSDNDNTDSTKGSSATTTS